MKLNYPIIITKGDENTAWGVIVPDLLGCYSGADEEKDIFNNAREAILFHLETVDSPPEPSPLSDPLRNFNLDESELGDYMISLIEIDTLMIESKVKRINISVPENALARIDNQAKQKGVSRSQLLWQSALQLELQV